MDVTSPAVVSSLLTLYNTITPQAISKCLSIKWQSNPITLEKLYNPSSHPDNTHTQMITPTHTKYIGIHVVYIVKSKDAINSRIHLKESTYYSNIVHSHRKIGTELSCVGKG